MKAQRGNRAVVLYLYSFLNLGARCSVLSAPRSGHFTTGFNKSNIVFGFASMAAMVTNLSGCG
jgi:hypothetical protein